MWVYVSVCPRSERKTTRAINVCGKTWTCFDHEVKRLKVKVTRLSRCVAGVGLQIDMTVWVSSCNRVVDINAGAWVCVSVCPKGVGWLRKGKEI